MKDDEPMSKAPQRVVGSASLSIDAEAEDAFDDLTEEQRDVIDRRLAEHARDPASAIPWEEGRTRLHRQFA